MHEPLDGAEILSMFNEEGERLSGLGVRRLAFSQKPCGRVPTQCGYIDLIAELEAGKRNLRNYISLVEFLEALLGRSVNLMIGDPDELDMAPEVREHILIMDVPCERP